MAAPEDIEKILHDVSSALELSSAGRKQLFNYWESNFGDYFKDLEYSATASFQSLVGAQVAIFAKQLSEAPRGRMPARARVRSSQLFVFEALIKWLSFTSGKSFPPLFISQLSQPHSSDSDYPAAHELAAYDLVADQLAEVIQQAPKLILKLLVMGLDFLIAVRVWFSRTNSQPSEMAYSASSFRNVRCS